MVLHWATVENSAALLIAGLLCFTLLSHHSSSLPLGFQDVVFALRVLKSQAWEELSSSTILGTHGLFNLQTCVLGLSLELFLG